MNESRATSELFDLIVDVLAMLFTVRMRSLVVIEPKATSDVHTVMVDGLAMPFTIDVPALVVTELRTASDVLAVSSTRYYPSPSTCLRWS